MSSTGKSIKVYTGVGCGAAASPTATFYQTKGPKADLGQAGTALKDIASKVATKVGKGPSKPPLGPAVGPGASVIKL